MGVTARYELWCEENPVEFFVIDRREIDRFEDGDDIQHYTPFHDTGRVCEGSGTLTAGDYYLIADNTTFGDQSPEGDV